jgi:hypothetical protein
MFKAFFATALFKGYQIGNEDTLILGEKSWANIRVLKSILIYTFIKFQG